MGSLSVEASGLRDLIGRLIPYKVLSWSSSSSDADTDRVRVPLDQADVISSRYDDGTVMQDTARHVVAIDIDHPAWLVKSTTSGHFHLYIEVPGGVAHDDYMHLLDALALAGVIENGYRNASKNRGFTCVRLPWVKKPSTS